MTPSAQVKAVEHQFEGSLSRFGHGLQRSFIFTLLQELAEHDDKGPRLLLGCEEPELYQHPPQALYLAGVMQQLSTQNAQVMVSTHSPHFVSGRNFEQIRMVRKDGIRPAARVWLHWAVRRYSSGTWPPWSSGTGEKSSAGQHRSCQHRFPGLAEPENNHAKGGQLGLRDELPLLFRAIKKHLLPEKGHTGGPQSAVEVKTYWGFERVPLIEVSAAQRRDRPQNPLPALFGVAVC